MVYWFKNLPCNTQGMLVWLLFRESKSPMCYGATKPVCRNQRVHALQQDPCMMQRRSTPAEAVKVPCTGALCTMQWRSHMLEHSYTMQWMSHVLEHSCAKWRSHVLEHSARCSEGPMCCHYDRNSHPVKIILNESIVISHPPSLHANGLVLHLRRKGVKGKTEIQRI